MVNISDRQRYNFVYQYRSDFSGMVSRYRKLYRIENIENTHFKYY